VLHTLFKVHNSSMCGRSADGNKPPPRALRCSVIEGQPSQQPLCLPAPPAAAAGNRDGTPQAGKQQQQLQLTAGGKGRQQQQQQRSQQQQAAAHCVVDMTGGDDDDEAEGSGTPRRPRRGAASVQGSPAAGAHANHEGSQTRLMVRVVDKLP